MISTIHHEDYTIYGWEVILPDSSCCKKSHHLCDMLQMHRTTSYDTNVNVSHTLCTHTLCMASEVKSSKCHSCDGQLLRRCEQRGSADIRGVRKPLNLKGKLCNMSDCWEYLGITLAYAVPVCHLWASGEGLFCQHYLVQGKPASRSFCTTLMRKGKFQMEHLETLHKRF